MPTRTYWQDERAQWLCVGFWAGVAFGLFIAWVA
jgi:hypothetical protein